VEPGYAITPRGREALRAAAVRGGAGAILEALAARPRSAATLRRKGKTEELRDLERDGLVVRRGVERAPAARPATQRVVAVAPGVDLEAALRGEIARAPKQAALLRRLADRGETPAATLAREFPRAPALLRALVARGLVTATERATPRHVLGAPVEPTRDLSPTAEQAEALKPIADAVRARRFETFLLHGVTGSGKTEIYLRAVGETLARGRQALVLVPEITLTHQILARLRGRFGDELAVLHSGLSPGERLEQWQRLRGGSASIAVGARSALFAPLENLGVIAIDEEHDSAYKNEEGFRYHARGLAGRRAARSHCPLILGSATPSLETRFAADRGQLRRLVLSRRIGGRPLPAVSLVDLTRERARARRGEKVILSRPLLRAIAGTLAEGGQTILFLNRRGFSTQVFCFECGFAERCANCDIALVYHSTEQRLRCHYCDFQTAPPETCSRCGAPGTALLGVGTERLEEEVRTHFPQARIARLDRDTARRRGFVQRVLQDLRAERIDILIGTQLVAKGHDFPGVRLVGVVVADTGLHLPDFRAAERTFQLLTQVAGRAGRDVAPGRVIVQTFVPEHYAIRPVLDHDYESFYSEELGHRAALGYPPFGQLLHALVSGADEEEARAAAQTLAAALRDLDPRGRDASPPAGAVEVLGPAPAPLARLRGRHRFQILVKGTDAESVRRAAEILVNAAARLPDPIQASVDTQPVDML
jgi:primosomal protein N' (replication factor Y)